MLPRLIARPSAVLVFGSRARGEALRDSDLDVLVVADAFRDVAWLDRPVRVHWGMRHSLRGRAALLHAGGVRAQGEELGIVRTAVAEGVDLLGAAA